MAAKTNLTAAAFLRQATQAAHHATEAALAGADLRKNTLSEKQYCALLTTNYRIWAAADEFLQRTSANSVYLAAVNRLHLAAKEEMSARSWKLPPDEALFGDLAGDQATVYGLQYVLFGSTLGGGMIARMLPGNPQLAGSVPFHFYQACGDVAKKLWPSFRQDINGALTQDAEWKTAAQTARRIFGLFREIYRATA